MDVFTAKKIHCIGIGGIGVSALASFWRAQGKEVSGSDAEESEITRALEIQGMRVEIHGRPPLNLPLQKGEKDGVDLVIYSDAVPDDHPERTEARMRGIPEMSYAHALGEVSRQYRTIVVTGTHGKSTTTALLGLMLEAAGMDPLVIVGSKVREWPCGNLRLPTLPPPPPTPLNLPSGRGEKPPRAGGEIAAFSPPLGGGVRGGAQVQGGGRPWCVVEGDDYRDHFLELSPYAVVVTNIEHDHPDYFRDLTHTIESFRKLAEKVPVDGFVVMNEDDVGCKKLHSAIRANRRMQTYGQASEVFSQLQLQVPGEFNRYNATAAAIAAMELGVPRDVVEKVVREFSGVWRRFEVVGTIVHNPSQPPLIFPPKADPPRAERGGELANVPPLKVRGGRGSYESHDGVLVISDYGHHPTAIRETMKAAREAYPDRRLMLVYQPHQHSRTKHLFKDFVEVLKDAADLTIVSEIYAVKGRMEDRDVSSRDIVNEITKLRNYEITNILYGGDLEQTKRVVLENVQSGDVIIFMGAGDIDNLAREMTK